MDNKDVTPLFVNGELNVGNRKKREKKQDNFKMPKKNPLADFLLTLIGIILVIYGVYVVINKDDNKNEESSNITSNVSNINKKEIDYNKVIILGNVESTNIYSASDIAGMSTVLSVNNLSNNAKLSLAARITNIKEVNGKAYILESDLDESIKNLFGDIVYTKSSFTYGNNEYTYNNETKRYYLLVKNTKKNQYNKYDHIEKIEENNTMIIRDYVVYTDNVKSFTINNVALTEVVNESNINEKFKLLKYYEYTFNKVNDNYYLSSISIK